MRLLALSTTGTISLANGSSVVLCPCSPSSALGSSLSLESYSEDVMCTCMIGSRFHRFVPPSSKHKDQDHPKCPTIQCMSPLRRRYIRIWQCDENR